MSTPVRAVPWALLSCVAGALGSVAAKVLGGSIPPVETAVFRMAAGTAVLVFAWRSLQELRHLKEPVWFAVRCIGGVIAIYALMRAFSEKESIALVTLLFFSRVFMMPLVARVLLGERLRQDMVVAALLGATGVAITIYPEKGYQISSGAVWALVGAVSSSISQTAVRRLSESHSEGVIVLGYMSVATAILALSMLMLPGVVGEWAIPSLGLWSWIAALGGLAVVAQFGAARALRAAPVGWVAPLDFAAVPVAASLDWLLISFAPALTALGLNVAAKLPSIYAAYGAVPILLSVVFVSVRTYRSRAA